MSLELLQGMEMKYEDREGDMLAVGRSSDVSELACEAQALFVSKRTKKAGTRIERGPRKLTGGPEDGAHSGAEPVVDGALMSCAVVVAPHL